MIIGIGTDILQIERLQAAYDRTNGRLAERVLGLDEMQVFKHRLARNHKRGIAFLATRFAAKEAFSKAIGLGMRGSSFVALSLGFANCTQSGFCAFVCDVAWLHDVSQNFGGCFDRLLSRSHQCAASHENDGCGHDQFGQIFLCKSLAGF